MTSSFSGSSLEESSYLEDEHDDGNDSDRHSNISITKIDRKNTKISNKTFDGVPDKDTHNKTLKCIRTDMDRDTDIESVISSKSATITKNKLTTNSSLKNKTPKDNISISVWKDDDDDHYDNVKKAKNHQKFIRVDDDDDEDDGYATKGDKPIKTTSKKSVKIAKTESEMARKNSSILKSPARDNISTKPPKLKRRSKTEATTTTDTESCYTTQSSPLAHSRSHHHHTPLRYKYPSNFHRCGSARSSSLFSLKLLENLANRLPSSLRTPLRYGYEPRLLSCGALEREGHSSRLSEPSANRHHRKPRSCCRCPPRVKTVSTNCEILKYSEKSEKDVQATVVSRSVSCQRCVRTSEKSTQKPISKPKNVSSQTGKTGKTNDCASQIKPKYRNRMTETCLKTLDSLNNVDTRNNWTQYDIDTSNIGSGYYSIDNDYYYFNNEYANNYNVNDQFNDNFGANDYNNSNVNNLYNNDGNNLVNKNFNKLSYDNNNNDNNTDLMLSANFHSKLLLNSINDNPSIKHNNMVPMETYQFNNDNYDNTQLLYSSEFNHDNIKNNNNNNNNINNLNNINNNNNDFNNFNLNNNNFNNINLMSDNYSSNNFVDNNFNNNNISTNNILNNNTNLNNNISSNRNNLGYLNYDDINRNNNNVTSYINNRSNSLLDNNYDNYSNNNYNNNNSNINNLSNINNNKLLNSIQQQQLQLLPQQQQQQQQLPQQLPQQQQQQQQLQLQQQQLPQQQQQQHQQNTLNLQSTYTNGFVNNYNNNNNLHR